MALMQPEFSERGPSLVLSKSNSRLHASKAASYYSLSATTAVRVSVSGVKFSLTRALKASRTSNSALLSQYMFAYKL